MRNRGYNPLESYRPVIRKVNIENRLLKDKTRVLDINAVLENNDFTKDELLIAELVLAEQAYLSDFEEIGDRIVAHVAQAKNKSKDVNFYLLMTQMNKGLCLQKAKDKCKYAVVKIKKV